ncbi:MAG: peptide chain release factor N(5)-glutamine methyltransferase, partial [Verrucomicrobia bacterium]|nr:peptide chain release factor N(5)-glutamine methyltransferase [Verrucomicrobiota bacterium]
YLRFGEVLKEEDLVRLRDLTRRRSDGEPLQHLLGTVDFLGNELISDHRALIPRPETEHLVDWMIREVKAGRLKLPASLLDVATGSGCIGLTLASAWKDCRVLLSDISEEALDLARMNASRLGLYQVKLVRSDLFEKITGCFDLITANLPYIPSAEIRTLSREVRRDPVLALDGGPDGLDIVRRFLVEVQPHLTDGGLIVLEVGHDQGREVADLAEKCGFVRSRLLADLAGIERFVIAEYVAPLAVASITPEANPTDTESAS